MQWPDHLAGPQSNYANNAPNQPVVSYCNQNLISSRSSSAASSPAFYATPLLDAAATAIAKGIASSLP